MLPNKNLTRQEFLNNFKGIGDNTLVFRDVFTIEFGETRDNARTVLTYDVLDERCYQLAKWGDELLPESEMLAILGEEVGEACKAYIEGDVDGYRAEMIQVAAVALRAVQTIDRKREKEQFEAALEKSQKQFGGAMKKLAGM